MKSVLNYPGAKWRVASWIISFFPEHRGYLEPFFGSGAVLFNKERSCIETVNDLDGEIVNLFECIQRDPEKLAHMIYFTPYARQTYDAQYSVGGTQLEPYTQAASFMIKCNQAHGFRNTGVKIGWKRDVAGRERAYAARAWADLPDVIIETAERLRGVQIEHGSAVELIKLYNTQNTLIFCDPPYVLSTRSCKQYTYEMTDNDHLELLDTLKKHVGPVLISGYESSLYDEELKHWHKETINNLDLLGQPKREVLWMNFEPIGQMNLFEPEARTFL